MSTLQPKMLYFGNELNANVYYVPSNTSTDYAIIKSMSFCSTSANSVISVHILRPGVTTADSNNVIISNLAIDANTTISYDASIVINQGSKVYVAGANGSAVVTMINGVQYV